MANCVGEAEELIKSAEKHHQMLTVGFVERLQPETVREVYKRVGEGKIGQRRLAGLRPRRQARSVRRQLRAVDREGRPALLSRRRHKSYCTPESYKGTPRASFTTWATGASRM